MRSLYHDTGSVQAFSVAGLTVWNSLPADMWDPECSVDNLQTVADISIFKVLVCLAHYENELYKYSHLTLTLALIL